MMMIKSRLMKSDTQLMNELAAGSNLLHELGGG